MPGRPVWVRAFFFAGPAPDLAASVPDAPWARPASPVRAPAALPRGGGAGLLAGADDFSIRPKSIFRPLLSNASMPSSNDKPILRCAACRSRKFEIHGPLTDHAVIDCATCGAQVAPYREFLSKVEDRVKEEHEQRKSRLH